MKLVPEYEGPHWVVIVLLIGALAQGAVNLAHAGDINDDINSYRWGAQSRQGIGSSYDQSDMLQRDSDRFQRDSDRSDREYKQFMDNEYGSQTPNPSCYLCNGY